MENNTLLGATEVVTSYDGSGIFNPTPGAPETAKEVATESIFTPKETKDEPEESVNENTGNSNTSTLLMYGGAALLLYYFFFKKK
jgi:LPXTG-motif cell wall-anchored protein